MCEDVAFESVMFLTVGNWRSVCLIWATLIAMEHDPPPDSVSELKSAWAFPSLSIETEFKSEPIGISLMYPESSSSWVGPLNNSSNAAVATFGVIIICLSLKTTSLQLLTGLILSLAK